MPVTPGFVSSVKALPCFQHIIANRQCFSKGIVCRCNSGKNRALRGSGFRAMLFGELGFRADGYSSVF